MQDLFPETIVYTPTRLNRETRYLIEEALPQVLVEGEITNLVEHRSGHVYFSLRDPQSEIRCALFARHAARVKVRLANGLKVRVRARPTVYEVKGAFQLIVDRVLTADEGDLARRFEQLKQQLMKEGLFADDARQPLPDRIGRVAIVTSPDGAALRDALKTLRRRMPLIAARIFPCTVTGPHAANEVCRALAAADAGWADVILLIRGGGSLEDLWTFNEEAVARAIHAVRTPLVTGIGHEVDFTIADMAADVRAETPTAAAARVSPDQRVLQAQLAELRRQLVREGERTLDNRRQTVDLLAARLRRTHPQERIQMRGMRLRQARSQLSAACLRRQREARQRLIEIRARLLKHAPERRLERRRHALALAARRLGQAAQRATERPRDRVERSLASLRAMSPRAVLDRGYAYLVGRDGRLIADAGDVHVQDVVTARLARGELDLTVAAVRPDED